MLRLDFKEDEVYLKIESNGLINKSDKALNAVLEINKNDIND
jgi:hypothetical protein